MKLETLAIHAGNEPDSATGAITPPIHLSTTFLRDEDLGYSKGFMYTRHNNPNRKQLESCLAALEGGEAALAFGSGSAAAFAVFQALQPGDHIIAPDDMYHGLRNQLKQIFIDLKMWITFIDFNEVENHIRPNTRLIWMETPSNPLMKITDIERVVHLAKQNNIITAVDNTFATPCIQRPLEMGVDVVMHATTKYINGHSDVLGGAVISKNNNEFFQRIRHIQILGGGVPSPFDCYLTLRGIRTLPYRMRGHSENALALAKFLEQHSRVEQVFYPGLLSHPDHQLAAKQMKNGFGGMLSFCVKGGMEKAVKVCNNTRLFLQATSLGGVESLIEHRASQEGSETKTPQNLLRVSVGLEHIDDLIADIDRALTI
ncbi:trans-sulfuration enzyme family protein [Solitalea lacus]|uniref:trans-sulfuration enzyme family protein n=1 Tax=Solitalea lacus TaxID=2911172 RepID=UPI001EDA2190|nr:aminotransferase class I/II-fold pyridoxal phosphate-dependent enzyme [Solitalea lacus]UKJ06082.1 aminotransferase class I/II-fold pyridoxal phosphate-dependent enzyme [Solitalea lacus]